MLAAVLGGLAFQIPAGRLSDRFDRRIVLAALSAGLAGAAVALVHLPRTLPVILPAAAMLGGFLSTLYPVCVADALDRMPADQVVAVSSRLILVTGLGSVLGPIIGMSVMERFAIDGVFYLIAATALLLALLAGGSSLGTASPTHHERPFEILAPASGTARARPDARFRRASAADIGVGKLALDDNSSDRHRRPRSASYLNSLQKRLARIRKRMAVIPLTPALSSNHVCGTSKSVEEC
jgi:MFS family permease